MTTILVVDDVPAVAEQYAYDLKRLGAYDALVAHGGREALEALEREPVDCVILDLEMPGMDGFEVLRAMERRSLRIPVIVYTGTGNYDRCTQAIRLGAQSFIDKAEPMERVVQEVENALARQRLVGQVAALRERAGADVPLVGASPAMQRLKDAIARVAKIPSPVLIVGESGSGKELVARELHRLGARPNGPFVALNSGALPESLVEDELFGHERGAFTGANVLRKGAFETAAGRTLCLDEMGAAPGWLLADEWKRNTGRELRNVVERMITAAETDVIALDDVPAEIRDGGGGDAPGASPGPPPTSFHALKAEAERRIIVAALERNDWHVTKTAQQLGLADHASLLKIMRRHGISRE